MLHRRGVVNRVGSLMKTRIYLIVFAGIAGAVALAAHRPAASIIDSPGTVDSGDGLTTVTWTSSKGDIVLRTPSDACSEAEFTGTVVAHGSGRTEEERSRNTD